MAGKHTPGPWIGMDGDYEDIDIVAHKDGERMFCIASDVGGEIHAANGSYEDFTEVLANARLISCAPDLLEALEAAYELLSSGPAIPDAQYSVVTNAAAAIARARGEG